jgi:hypothetical protein
MDSIAIIINSCYKFHKTTIGPIIDSAKKAKIPSSQIYVVVGESDEESFTKYLDYNIIFCKYVNVDYNGIIYFTQTEHGLNELQKYTHFFYIHDTSVFMESFWEKIKNYAINCQTYIKLEEIHSKNIGLINIEWFLRKQNKKELFKHFINYDKSLVYKYKEAEFPNKDFIFKNFKNLPQFLNEDCMFLFYNFTPVGEFFKNDIHKEIGKVYSSEDRLITIYQEPGIIKFQKNWGMTDDWNLDL